jgi:hypothetical protein
MVRLTDTKEITEMSICDHSKLVVLHVLNEEFDNVFDGDVILRLGTTRSDGLSHEAPEVPP